MCTYSVLIDTWVQQLSACCLRSSSLAFTVSPSLPRLPLYHHLPHPSSSSSTRNVRFDKSRCPKVSWKWSVPAKSTHVGQSKWADWCLMVLRHLTLMEPSRQPNWQLWMLFAARGPVLCRKHLYVCVGVRTTWYASVGMYIYVSHQWITILQHTS